ncbi:MAG TPA: hypothetical protein DD719_03460 [Desulfotomaculum sp.]|nr:hypothetical protein [Desulfotomaculum sp.]
MNYNTVSSELPLLLWGFFPVVCGRGFLRAIRSGRPLHPPFRWKQRWKQGDVHFASLWKRGDVLLASLAIVRYNKENLKA